MKIDRLFFDRFADTVRNDSVIADGVESEEWDRVAEYVHREIFNKPGDFYTLAKLRRAVAVDRRLTIRELLEQIFGRIPRFKSREELLEDEFGKFIADHDTVSAEAIPPVRNYFKSYASSGQVRHIIDSGELTDLATNPGFTLDDLRMVPIEYRSVVPEYIKDYVSLNQFV